MENGHKFVFAFVAVAIIIALVCWQCWPVSMPTLIADNDGDPDDTRLGDSSQPASNGDVSGPSYLAANVPLYFPPPLMALNPVTSTETE